MYTHAHIYIYTRIKNTWSHRNTTTLLFLRRVAISNEFVRHISTHRQTAIIRHRAKIFAPHLTSRDSPTDVSFHSAKATSIVIPGSVTQSRECHRECHKVQSLASRHSLILCRILLQCAAVCCSMLCLQCVGERASTANLAKTFSLFTLSWKTKRQCKFQTKIPAHLAMTFRPLSLKPADLCTCADHFWKLRFSQESVWVSLTKHDAGSIRIPRVFFIIKKPTLTE